MITLLIIALIAHHKFFSYHYEKDPYIHLFTKEKFDLKYKNFKIPFKKKFLDGYLYYKDIKYKNKLIIFAHGMWSNHESYMQDIAYYALQGYMVFSFDYYGVAKSEGKTIRGFGNSIKSLDYAIRYIKNDAELKDKELYVIGHSWGGFATINIVKYHKDIKKICALSPFVSIPKILDTTLKGIQKMFIPFMVLVDYFKCGKYSFSNGVKSLKNYNGKIMLIQSIDDKMVPYVNAVGYIKKKLNDKDINYLILNDRGHNPNYTKEAILNMKSYAEQIKGLEGDILNDFKMNYNFHSMGELDEKTMKEIMDYLND